ncbi:zinc finger protein OZF isoform X2 [Cryptotermes secundus]|uniref:zinc finger protein OZF isoform X2 n=1 Tax=Cryptotermes secundus TaxID=105785 RepID=UPI001454D9F3|nr:zinc finger protein OZF isoform X2 [Cryptotermes secundus]
MSLNFGSICRLCMTQTNTMLPLFSEDCVLQNRIMAVVSVIKLHVDDGLPSQVCQQCVHQVNNAYNFKLLCESSDFALRQYLSTGQSENQPYQTSSPVDEPSLDDETDVKPFLSFSVDKADVSQGMEECSAEETKFSSSMKDIGESAQQHCFTIEGIEKHSSQPSEELSQCHASVVVDAVKGLFPCNICGKSFINKHKLKEHVTRHVGGRPHECEVCGKRFTERSSLKKHAISHTGQKAYVCEVCGKRFTLLTHLKAHTLVHTGQKSHICDICGKRFSHLGSLRIHALLHTGEKPFSCNMCGRSFTQKNNLKTHIAAHAGQKPHVCSVCCKSFAQHGHLKTHAIVHSGRKEFCCDVCGSSFTRKHNLKKHAAKHVVH